MHGTVLRTLFQKSFKSNYAPSTQAAKPSLLTGTGFLFLSVCSFLFGLTFFFFFKLSPSHLFLVMCTGTATLQKWCQDKTYDAQSLE